MQILQGVGGLLFFLLLAWAISEDRNKVHLKTIALGLGAQFLIAALTLEVPIVHRIFLWINKGVDALNDSMLEGTHLVYGYLSGLRVPFEVKPTEGTFIFMFQALPMLMVMSSLAMLLYYWRILPVVIRFLSLMFQKTLHIGGALGACTALNIFLGHGAAALFVRPYLNQFSRSELFSMMTVGMATTSISFMTVYSNVLGETIPNPVSHILASPLISIPGALVLSRIMVPQEGEDTMGDGVSPYQFLNFMDAVSQGTRDGMTLMYNVGASLLVAYALITLVNKFLGIVLPVINDQSVTLQLLSGYLLAPVTWLMGVPFSESAAAGSILGTKTVLGEGNAFFALSHLPIGSLCPISTTIMLYAVCGFANISSVVVQVSSICALAPERRAEVTALGFRALLAGTLASCMSGTIIGILCRA